MHIAELRGTQNLAVAAWHALGVQHIGQRDFVGIGHIRMPALAGIIQADRLARLIPHIGQDHHFRMAWRMEHIGDIHFQIAKALAEGRHMRRFQILLREAKHAIFAKGAQKRAEILR